MRLIPAQSEPLAILSNRQRGVSSLFVFKDRRRYLVPPTLPVFLTNKNLGRLTFRLACGLHPAPTRMTAGAMWQAVRLFRRTTR